jgi:hypothetical protein
MSNYQKKAFPSAGFQEVGMTLREYYAGQAMAALVGRLEDPERNLNLIQMPRLAVDFADALIAELEKE